MDINSASVIQIADSEPGDSVLISFNPIADFLNSSAAKLRWVIADLEGMMDVSRAHRNYDEALRYADATTEVRLRWPELRQFANEFFQFYNLDLRGFAGEAETDITMEIVLFDSGLWKVLTDDRVLIETATSHFAEVSIIAAADANIPGMENRLGS